VLASHESRRQTVNLISHVAGSYDLRGEAWDQGGQEVATIKTVSIESVFEESAAADDLTPESIPDPFTEKPHVLFTLAGTDYAVPVDNVVEIGRPSAATPIPNLPDWVVGVTSARGDVVSLVDLRRFLGLPRCEPGPRNRVVLARSADVITGLLVDRVEGIRSLTPPASGAAVSVGHDRVRPYIQGVSEYNGRRVVFLNLDRLLLSPQMRQFDPA